VIRPVTNGKTAETLSGDRPESEPPNPLQRLVSQLDELRGELATLAAVEVDKARLHAERAISAALADLGITLGVSILALIGAVYLVAGAAGGLGELLGRSWLGGIAAGALAVGAAVLTLRSRGQRKLSQKHAELVEKYERRRARQRARLAARP
jgi:hypothetical protein